MCTVPTVVVELYVVYGEVTAGERNRRSPSREGTYLLQHVPMDVLIHASGICSTYCHGVRGGINSSGAYSILRPLQSSRIMMIKLAIDNYFVRKY